MANIYDSNGNVISINATSSIINYDSIVKGVAHRGYSTTAPENTLPAYKLAKKNGFTYVECDICWTSDGIPVLSHDTTIDRCSNGSGTISNMTLAQLETYDFGSWKSATYAGTKIPTFEEFMALCRALGLHPYLDLRDMTTARFTTLFDIYSAYGYAGKVTWIAYSSDLTKAAAVDPYARLGLFATSTITSTTTDAAIALRTGTNEVFIDASVYDDASCTACQAAGVPLEVWTIDTASTILNLNPYITGVTSNSKVAGQLLYEANID